MWNCTTLGPVNADTTVTDNCVMIEAISQDHEAENHSLDLNALRNTAHPFLDLLKHTKSKENVKDEVETQWESGIQDNTDSHTEGCL